MRAAITSAFAGVLLLAIPATAGTSGLRGVVRRGPITPVCVPENPCSAPAAGVVLTFERGTVTRRATSAKNGSYRIALTPGTYRVTIAGARFGYSPRTAVVRAGVVTVRNFTIDTGIR